MEKHSPPFLPAPPWKPPPLLPLFIRLKTKQSTSIVITYPALASIKANGYSTSVKSSKVSFASLRKCIIAVPKNTPPANCVPRTKNPSFHFKKYGEIPPINVPKNTIIKHQIFTRISDFALKSGAFPPESDPDPASESESWSTPWAAARRKRPKRRSRTKTSLDSYIVGLREPCRRDRGFI